MKHWYFWVLAPIMLVTALGLPVIVSPPTETGRAVMWLFSLCLLAATLGLANPLKFSWAFSFVALTVLIAAGGYLTSEMYAWWSGKPFFGDGRKSGTSLLNALMFLVVFGLPAFRYLTLGRSGVVDDEMLDDNPGEDEDDAH